MMTGPEEKIIGEGRTIDEAAEDAAKKISDSIRDETYEVTIYAVLSGEHNPIHGYRIALSPGSP